MKGLRDPSWIIDPSFLFLSLDPVLHPPPAPHSLPLSFSPPLKGRRPERDGPRRWLLRRKKRREILCARCFFSIALISRSWAREQKEARRENSRALHEREGTIGVGFTQKLKFILLKLECRLAPSFSADFYLRPVNMPVRKSTWASKNLNLLILYCKGE